jgi:hypothetical protein
MCPAETASALGQQTGEKDFVFLDIAERHVFQIRCGLVSQTED